jgi:hypothetical protein
MSHEDRTGRVRATLFEDWDPVGFGPVLPADEYDAYIPGIIHLLENHCTAEQLEAHLVKTEKERFGGELANGRAFQAATNLLTSWATHNGTRNQMAVGWIGLGRATRQAAARLRAVNRRRECARPSSSRPCQTAALWRRARPGLFMADELLEAGVTPAGLLQEQRF